MEPNQKYTDLGAEFFAFVRFASESIGYSHRKKKGDTSGLGKLRKYELSEILSVAENFVVTETIAKDALDYMNWRAEALTKIQSQLMDKNQAKGVYDALVLKHTPKKPVTMNKQKKEKAHINYFTGIINILTEIHLGGNDWNSSPEKLITFTDERNQLQFTLSRRMDGAYPSLRNPIAFWEIKEYYGTTTFGSRVADGVYETQLDGYEVLEAKELTKKEISHYLFVDDRFTWWEKGKSYLCRLVDLMHMGLATEVIFGQEVLTRWPEIVKKMATK